MKRLWINLFLAFGTVCSYGTVLHAQSYEMVAKVPFAFHVDKTDFQAGDYKLEKSMTLPVQFIENRDGHKCAIPGGTYLESKGKPRLVFHRYGDDYFLSEIWNTQGTGSKLKVNKREREVSERTAPEEIAMVAIEVTLAQ